MGLSHCGKETAPASRQAGNCTMVHMIRLQEYQCTRLPTILAPCRQKEVDSPTPSVSPITQDV